jgi:hypothetical protein
MKKKLWITILVLTMTTAVFAQKAEPERSFRYKLTDDEKGIVITAYTGTNPNLVIPRTIEGYPVKKIGTEGLVGISVVNICGTDLRNSSRLLQTVIVPEGVEIIGEHTFSNCINLRKVVLPSTVYLIESSAFGYCSNLAEINIPTGISIIDYGAFQNCGELYDLIIPTSITSIDFGFLDHWGRKTASGNQFRGCGKIRIATRKKLEELGYVDGFSNY